MHRRDAEAYSRSKSTPRSFAVVDGRRVAYIRAGTGLPTIVLLSGAGMDIDSWFKIFPAAATIGTAIAIDRLGVGRSDRPVVPQTGAVVVATLRAMLLQVGAPPPYVLVGHSLGGLYADLFARCHPADVCGVVLVESASPEEAVGAPQGGRFARAIDRMFDRLDRLRGRADLGEVDAVPETVRQLAAAPRFPDVPLVVITGGHRMRMVPQAAFAAHLEAQRGRVVLSPRARQVVSARSGHLPQLQDPDTVIDAIRSVAADVATGERA
jgi:pimeloyl-ACP methyl ester carboxylesterase